MYIITIMLIKKFVKKYLIVGRDLRIFPLFQRADHAPFFGVIINRTLFPRLTYEMQKEGDGKGGHP